LQARELNPAVFTPDWQGRINSDLEGTIRWSKAKPPEGAVKAELLNSVLRKKALSGRIDARWSKGMLDLTQFDMHGDGFDLSASGILQEQLSYQIRVSDLSSLIPRSKGRLMANGWVKWRESQLAGVLKGTGSAISTFGGGIGQIVMEASINGSGTDSLRGTIKAKELAYHGLKVASAEVTADGTLSKHNVRTEFAWPGSGISASFHGGYAGGVWQGTITELTGSDVDFGAFKLSNPSELKVSADQLLIKNMAFSGSSREKLNLAADLRLDPMRGSISGNWQELNIGRANGLLVTPKVSGRTSGSARAEWIGNAVVRMTALAAVIDLTVEAQSRMRISSAEAKLDWNEKGLLATLGASLEGAGKLEGRFHSEEQAHMGMPEAGWFAATWNALDLGMVKAWLPPGVDTKGLMDGQVNGRLLPGSVFQITGKTRLSQGVLAWKSSEGIISAEAREASLEIEWRDKALKGDLSIALLSRGNLKASFQVPLPAKLPVKFEPEGPLKASAKGDMAEKGLLTAMFPGLFGESRGQLQFDLGAGGTWRTPDFGGKIRLSDAGAYLNQPGIRLQDVGAEAELRGDRISISSFRARSGSGSVRGSAEVTLGEGRVVRYEGKLLGEKFQAVYLPEIQVLANPDLNFEGTMERFALKGSINVPEALIRYEGKEGIVSSSSDVVIADAREKQRKPFRMALDMQVNVILGDKVRIEALGLDTRLEGKVLLKAQSFDRITADGRIQTVKGLYKRRGISLDVTRGSVVFAGRAVDLATLDILAVRKIHDPRRFNDIQAGVTVTGTLRSPLVKLYSEPAMADADVLSYMVLGKPLADGTESSQTSLLMQAAGTILAKDQSSTVQNQVKRFVGIDTFDVQSGSQTTLGQQKTVPQIGGQQIGSSPLSSVQSTTVGKTSTTAGSSAVASSIVTVGKYLSPDLYVAFGRSLFSNDYLITTRYSLPKRWELEGSRRGVETGVDLFYKIEFE
jgi:translocation and assembly module TamB